MTGGILGRMFEPETVAQQRIAAEIRIALFGFVGAPTFVEGLTEEQSDVLLAAALGIEPDALPYVGAYVTNHLRDDERRKKQRERLWQIEASVIERVGAELDAELDRVMAGPKTTKKTYASHQRHFAAFCERLGVPSLPASEAAVAAYILDSGLSRKTLGRRLAAIANLHRQEGHVFPAKKPLVRVALQHALKAAEIQQPAEPVIAGQREATRNG